MKFVQILAFSLAVSLGVSGEAVRAQGAATYTNVVNGSLSSPAPGIVNPFYLQLEVSGDTSGSLKTAIQYNNSGNIVGGDWTLTSGSDGSDRPLGTLSGTFYGGTVEVNAAGAVVAVKGATLVIERATGAYAAAAAGRGMLDGALDGAEMPTFAGSLSITF